MTPALVTTLIALLIGFGAGLASFGALWISVRAYSQGNAARGLVLHLARAAVVVCGLVLAARSGAGPLLGALVGLLLARSVSMRLAGRAA